MFQKILVPVDFTEKNETALNVALQFALQNKAEVVLLHVIEKVEHLPARELQDFYERLEIAAREKLDNAGRRFREQQVNLREEVTYGKRAEEIVRFADSGSFDLIVVSSHKVEQGQRWGTLSYQMAILAQCPVLLLK